MTPYKYIINNYNAIIDHNILRIIILDTAVLHIYVYTSVNHQRCNSI